MVRMRTKSKDLPEETPNYIPYKNFLINGIITILVIIQLRSSLSSGDPDLLLGKEITKINKNDTVQSAVLSSPSSIPLPPVHINSSWIGNQWVPPPGYMLYSANEIQNYFHQQSILIVGDSTARQLYSTLYGILNATENPDNIIVNDVDSSAGRVINIKQNPRFCQKEGYQVCRKMPTSSSSNQSSTSRHNYDLFYGACLVDLANIAKNESGKPDRLWTEWVQDYSLVIFSIGPHEISHRSYCGTAERKIPTDNFFNEFFQNDDYLNGSNTTFVWRTWGSPLTDDEKVWNQARAHNAYVKTLIDANEISRKEAGKVAPSSISYIDFGQAMLPRLYPSEKRICGDSYQHYGIKIRLATVQMLMNHLVERDRQKKLMIHPWLSKNLITTRHGYNDSEKFMTVTLPGEPPFKPVKNKLCVFK